MEEELLKAQKRSNVILVCVLILMLLMVLTLVFLVLSLNSYSQSIHAVLANLEEITNDLNALDLEAMVTQFTDVVGSANQTLSDASSAIDALDFVGLNDAITDLKTIIEPLAGLFGKLR